MEHHDEGVLHDRIPVVGNDQLAPKSLEGLTGGTPRIGSVALGQGRDGEEEQDEDSIWGDELDEEDEDSIWGDELAGEDDDAGIDGSDEYIPPKPVSEYNDAVAIQLPFERTDGIRKPYFLLGDAENPVDLWFLDVAQEEALQFTGRGSDDLTLVEATDVTAVASYEGGQWSVIFRRPLESYEGVDFREAQFVPIAFSVWDGFNRERGNKRALSSWFYLYVEPTEHPSPVGPMVRAGLITLVVLTGLIFWIRRRFAPGVASASHSSGGGVPQGGLAK